MRCVLMNGSKILLGEDNPDDILLTKRALNQARIESDVIVAKNGLEALNYLQNELKNNQKKNGLPDLVLLDLNLPKMSGHEFLKEVRNESRFRLIPIVILSSSGETMDIEESYLLGANSYIQKPVDFEQFVSTVQTLSTYWLNLNLTSYSGV